MNKANYPLTTPPPTPATPNTVTASTHPLYWSDLIAGWINKKSNPRADQRHRYQRACSTSIDQLRASFARDERPISPTSQMELADTFIEQRLMEFSKHPAKFLQAIHCLKSIWASLYQQGLVKDAQLLEYLDGLHKKVHQRIVFCHWLSSWPSDLGPQPMMNCQRLLQLQQSAHQIFTSEQCADFWNWFSKYRTTIAKHYHHQGHLDLKRYTLNMNRIHFLKTAPIGDYHIAWQQQYRAKTIRQQYRSKAKPTA